MLFVVGRMGSVVSCMLSVVQVIYGVEDNNRPRTIDRLKSFKLSESHPAVSSALPGTQRLAVLLRHCVPYLLVNPTDHLHVMS